VSAAALIAMALAMQATPAAEDLDRFYECEVTARMAGATLRLSSRLGEEGLYGGGSGFASTDIADNRPTLAVRWNFLAIEQEVHKSYVTIDVPLPRKLPDRQVMRLMREDPSPAMMALAGPAYRSTSVLPRANAAVDLDILLVYAEGVPQLRWEVGAAPIGKTRGAGWLDLAPLRAVKAAFPPLLAELRAKQAAYKTQCGYREEPHNSDGEI
jgi:hypothetical protein